MRHRGLWVATRAIYVLSMALLAVVLAGPRSRLRYRRDARASRRRCGVIGADRFAHRADRNVRAQARF